jgi:hypothetical protein
LPNKLNKHRSISKIPSIVGCQDGSYKRKKLASITAAIVVFGVFAILLSSGTIIATTIVYAQSSTNPPPTITAKCLIDYETYGIPRVYAEIKVGNLSPPPTLYYEKFSGTQYDGQKIEFQNWRQGSIGGYTTYRLYVMPGTTTTYRIYEDFNGDRQDPPPPEELVGEKSIVCEGPTLADIFKNQGECIKYGRENPSSGISKAECRAAFK